MDIGLEKEHQQYLGYLTFIREKFNYKQGWIAIRFKQNYGFYPPWDYIYTAIEPPKGLIKALQYNIKPHQVNLKKAIEYEASQSAITLMEHQEHSFKFTPKKERVKKEVLQPKFY